MGVRNSQDDAIDLIKDILFFFLTTAFAFGYFMLMLLIISFVSMSYIHFTIEAIVAISIVATIIVDIFYVRGKIRQRREEKIARKNSDFFKRLENVPWMKPKKAAEEVDSEAEAAGPEEVKPEAGTVEAGAVKSEAGTVEARAAKSEVETVEARAAKSEAETTEPMVGEKHDKA